MNHKHIFCFSKKLSSRSTRLRERETMQESAKSKRAGSVAVVVGAWMRFHLLYQDVVAEQGPTFEIEDMSRLTSTSARPGSALSTHARNRASTSS